MDNICTICFDEMDMNSYQDDQDQTLTCYKLECGHAYHTKCIVTCLQKMNNNCPNCRSQKTPQEILTLEGLVSQLLNEVRRGKQLKLEMDGYKASVKNYEDSLKQLKNDTKQFIETRKTELNIPQKRKQFYLSTNRVKSKFLKICREKGPMYLGAYKNLTEWRRDRFLFSPRRKMYKLRNPYVYVRI